MLGYLRCKMGGGMGEGSISNMANAYIQKSMVSIRNIICNEFAYDVAEPFQHVIKLN